MKAEIKILGPGCAKCKTLDKLTREVVAENNLDASVEKVEDIVQIMSYSILATPALVINEKVVYKGGVPSKEQIKELINKAVHG
ncbi:MAG TPA: thioredoxin family protein [Bacteroidales bacterium]|nr:thioredoxin family protein [Bacteroidales bacterium]HRZ47996.1 thioredoxin family protein [Bacteroidales bacterium]